MAYPTRTASQSGDQRHTGGYARAFRAVTPGEEVTVNDNAGDDALSRGVPVRLLLGLYVGQIPGFRHLSRQQTLRVSRASEAASFRGHRG